MVISGNQTFYKLFWGNNLFISGNQTFYKLFWGKNLFISGNQTFYILFWGNDLNTADQFTCLRTWLFSMYINLEIHDQLWIAQNTCPILDFS